MNCNGASELGFWGGGDSSLHTVKQVPHHSGRRRDEARDEGDERGMVGTHRAASKLF